MIKRVSIFIFGLCVYILFLGTVLYAIGFVGNIIVPKNIDDGTQTTLLYAVTIDVVLVLIFGLQHTIMARTKFKEAIKNTIPDSMERSFFVLCATLSLLLLFIFWIPIPQTIWNFQTGFLNVIFTVVFWIGWLDIIFCTFLISHFDLFGVRQVYYYLLQKTYEPVSFKEPLFYRYVRHPLMFAFLIGFWVTPNMTIGHLLFSSLMTLYIIIGIKFEEQSLKNEFGESYGTYQRKVPMIIPLPRK